MRIKFSCAFAAMSLAHKKFSYSISVYQKIAYYFKALGFLSCIPLERTYHRRKKAERIILSAFSR
jgi:hypothetical protein